MNDEDKADQEAGRRYPPNDENHTITAINAIARDAFLAGATWQRDEFDRTLLDVSGPSSHWTIMTEDPYQKKDAE